MADRRGDHDAEADLGYTRLGDVKGVPCIERAGDADDGYGVAGEDEAVSRSVSGILGAKGAQPYPAGESAEEEHALLREQRHENKRNDGPDQGSNNPVETLGQHQAILGAELWDQVQSCLVQNRVDRHQRADAAQPGLLTGLVFDGDGERMSPTHANKKGDAHDFYNPTQHPFFDQEGGRVIYLEGSYVNTFSGNPQPTPYYEYNQIMYRLDLANPRLTLPPVAP